MRIELIRDADRPNGWWLLVGGSEQSFVDVDDPRHLEFEYVQMISHLLDTVFDSDAPLRALHLGGGLCTVPRWVAATHPGSTQRVAERSAEIAALSASLGTPAGVTVRVADAVDVVARARPHTADLVVCDVYEGPETVTELFTLDQVRRMHRLLRPGGAYVCNLSDATPFDMSKVVTATLQADYPDVVLLAEPPVLRGRRSGNLVLAATDQPMDLAALARRAASGAVRARVVAGEELKAFVGTARPATTPADIPASAESTGIGLL